MTAIPALKTGIVISPYQPAPGSQQERFLLEVEQHHFLISAKSRALIVALQASPANAAELEQHYQQHSGASLPAADLLALAQRTLPPALFADTPSTPRRNPFTVSIDLLSPRRAGVLTEKLTWLFQPRLAWPLVALFLMVHACVLPDALRAAHSSWSASSGVTLIALLLLSGLIHELGHSTACRYFNCPHGAIGFGLYLIFPAWYADVSKAWRLQRRQRAVVDLGGVYFQSVSLIAVDLYALYSGDPGALKLIWMVTFTMLFTLNPVFKFDGYWLLSDLSGQHNLHRQVRAAGADLLMPLFGRARRAPPSLLLLTYGTLSTAYLAYFASFLWREVGHMAQTLPGALSGSLQRLQAAGTTHLIDAGWSLWSLLGQLLWPTVIASACAMLVLKLCKAVGELRLAIHSARLASRPGSYTERQQRQRVDANTTRLAVKGMQQILKLSQDDALSHANAAAAAYQQLCDQRPASGTVAAAPAPLLRDLEHGLTQHACLLALPFNIPALQLLRQLAASELRLTVIGNPMLDQVMAGLGLQHVSTLTTGQAVRELKRGPQPRHTLYISFPELHASSDGTRAWMHFNGTRYSRSVLEGLLCCLGLGTLYTLGTDNTLASLPLTPQQPREAGRAIADITGWLATHLQQAAAARPDLSLAWAWLYRASDLYLAVERADQLKQLSAYVDAWQRAGLAPAVHAAARAQLAAWSASPFPTQRG
ncbi:hypothetical protein GJ699_17175 [Duganella sp. FT80W]|uniref:Peptide zinc metalloprotease protein n=1 Tax=Duganella guangzhouensis TaxID=2666084 RepID=A0A6I2L0L1_9BURK|nr:hypothetical protein [Duganella guangzhouensis]MRW91728.1 hypothetical protein [Duganella guangzhouensis]